MESGKIFIIEDEFTKKVGLADILREAGHTVATGSGDAVLEKIKQEKPSLIITDVIDSENPGEATAFLEKIKAEESLKKTTVFIYTEKIGVSLEVQLRRMKMGDYFIKEETNIEVLVRSVKQLYEPEPEADTSLMDRSRGYDLDPAPPIMGEIVQGMPGRAPQPPQRQPPPAAPPSEKETFGEMFQEFSEKVHEQLGDDDAETIYNLGISYMDMGLYEEAIKEFDNAAKSDQYKLETTSMIGVCLRNLNKYDEAIDKLKEGAKLTRDPVELMGVKYEIGITLTEAGKLKEAFNMLASIYKQDKQYRDVAKRLVAIKKKLQG